jgi:hypothetical protein
VQLAGQRCARAAVELDRAEARAAALQDQAPAQDLVRQRLEAVEAALTVQVEAAVSTPAPYLTAALGEAPEGSTKPTTWREAAVRIETYRHAELGRSPADGPVVDDTGLIGAIGPRPHDYLDGLQWDHAAEFLAPAVELEVQAPGLELGP